MHRMSVKLSFFTVAMGGAIAAFGAGFDGLSLATNDWFDADFTALTADTAIAAGSTTGITLGTGSWTAFRKDTPQLLPAMLSRASRSPIRIRLLRSKSLYPRFGTTQTIRTASVRTA